MVRKFDPSRQRFAVLILAGRNLFRKQTVAACRCTSSSLVGGVFADMAELVDCVPPLRERLCIRSEGSNPSICVFCRDAATGTGPVLKLKICERILATSVVS